MIVITVARRPLSEVNVASNVLTHGTGAMNIDATRIAHDSATADEAVDPTRVQRQGAKGDGTVDNAFGAGCLVDAIIAKPLGRWPANLVLGHKPGCVQEGGRKIRGHKGYPNGPGGKSTPMHGWGQARSADVRPDSWAGHADANGLKTIASWSCVEGCPVLDMDEQSGINTNTVNYSYARSGEGFIGSIPSQAEKATWWSETGGAARYFKQFGGQKS